MARKAYTGLAYLFVLGVVIQVFLAGIGIFGNFDSDLDPHRMFGFIVLTLIPILMFLAALAGKMGRTFIGLTVLLFLMVFLQSVWVSFDTRWLKAVHPTMAVFM